MRVGGAEVSTKHANFIVAHPGCKADDVLKLVKLIREKVYDKNQIQLESRSADLAVRGASGTAGAEGRRSDVAARH